MLFFDAAQKGLDDHKRHPPQRLGILIFMNPPVQIDLGHDIESPFFVDIHEHACFHSVTDLEGVTKHLNDNKPVTFYAGFDPTADSLHVGRLLPIITMARFQKAGHKPLALVGGATGMIGDPSGKSEERNLLTEELLQKNVDGIRNQLSRFLDMENPDNGADVVNNGDWFKPINFIEFLMQHI